MLLGLLVGRLWEGVVGVMSLGLGLVELPYVVCLLRHGKSGKEDA